MRYTFQCSDPDCASYTDLWGISIKEGPPPCVQCFVCGCHSDRVWLPPQLLIRGDPDDIAPKHQLVDTSGMTTAQAARWGGMTPEGAARKERTYKKHIEERRATFAKNKQHGGRMTHSVPAELYHAKIKESGDRNYWSDPTNLNRHKSCKVS